VPQFEILSHLFVPHERPCWDHGAEASQSARRDPNQLGKLIVGSRPVYRPRGACAVFSFSFLQLVLSGQLTCTLFTVATAKPFGKKPNPKANNSTMQFNVF